MTMTPFFPPQEGELTQGYFARMGHLHAQTDVVAFMRYVQLSSIDFRDGADRFIDLLEDLTGADRALLERNTLKSLPKKSLSVAGHELSPLVVRRSVIRVCCECLLDDMGAMPTKGASAFVFKRDWLFRQVVRCPVHHSVLVETPVPDPARVYDLASTLVTGSFDPRKSRTADAPVPPGPMQNYVLGRIDGQSSDAHWLDQQTITQAAKACEMLGALLVEGPEAQILTYSEADWARVADEGFRVAAVGPTAIVAELTRIRQTSGRTSGRAGPQAVFGKLYSWLHNTAYGVEVGAIRDVVKEAILWNFPLGPGDTVFGDVVETRRVHSANTLINKTGKNRLRLYRLLTKMKFIPPSRDAIAINQYVFPAEEVERIVIRIERSVPLNKVNTILGCGRTHEEALARHGLINSVVPIDGDNEVGLTIGAYNIDDLEEFLASVCIDAVQVPVVPDGHCDLAHAVRKATTVPLIKWQRDGKLKNTVLFGSKRRLDRLYFDPVEIDALMKAARPADIFRLNVAARMIGTGPEILKRLGTSIDGDRVIVFATAEECVGLPGQYYLTQAEIDRFNSVHATLFALARGLGVHPNRLRKDLDSKGIKTVRDPEWVGARVYRRADLEAL